MQHSPSDVIAKLLVDLSVGTDPDNGSAWPVYVAKEPTNPDNAITIYDTSGIPFGRGMDGEIWEDFSFQVRVRSTTHVIGWRKAWAVREALRGVYQASVSLSSTYLVHAITRIGSVVIAGKEGAQRSLFTVNAFATILEAD